MNTHHVVMTSSGKASWYVGHLVATEIATPADTTTFLFTDVKGDNPSQHAGEDLDNYRFLVESTAHTLGRKVPTNEGVPTDFTERARRLVDSAPSADTTDVVPHARHTHLRDLAATHLPELVWLLGERDIWQVFKDDRFLGNSRLANCSKFLKQQPARRWLDDRCDPNDTIVYVGIDLGEIHRLPDIQAAYAHPFGKPCGRPTPCKPQKRCTSERPCRKHQPCTDSDPCDRRLETPWTVAAPLCDTTLGTNGREVPRWLKNDIDSALHLAGIREPRMYGANFEHANCGGGCVRGGHQHFKTLLQVNRARYLYWERKEQELRDHLGKNVAILKHRSGPRAGEPMTLREFRADQEDQGLLFDPTDFMGCAGCFVDFDREDGAA